MTNVINSKRMRVVVMLALAVVLVLSMSVSAFAAAPGQYTTHVYQSGTGTDSMANAAVLGADYNPNTGLLTVYVGSVDAYNTTGYITAFDLDGVAGEPNITPDPDEDVYPTSFTFELENLSGTTQLDADFGITLLVGDHPEIPASADFVVYLPTFA
jgi:hypothetical protein